MSTSASDSGTIEQSNIPLYSPYGDLPTNGIIPLYSGNLRFKADDQSVIRSGSLELRLLGGVKLHFTVPTAKRRTTNAAEGAIYLADVKHCEPDRLVTLRRHASLLDGNNSMTGILNGNGLILRELEGRVKPVPVDRIMFHLFNFRETGGALLSQGSPRPRESWAGRVQFTMGPWQITLDQLRDAKDRRDEAKETSGYTLTHICQLRRTDFVRFNPDDSETVFDALHWFLSFVNGAHSGCAMRLGFTENGLLAWQHWHIPKVSRLNPHKNRFSDNPPLPFLKASQDFFSCWCDPIKREWLQSACGMYLGASRNYSGIEITLSNSQILVEMLTWVALMEEASLMSQTQFRKLSAADKVRQLLQWLGLQPLIPPALLDLTAASQGMDGPETVVAMRNVVIHASKSNRVKRAAFSDKTFYQAWQYNMWIAEVTILKLIGYSGAYNNRFGNPSLRLWDMLPWTPATTT